MSIQTRLRSAVLRDDGGEPIPNDSEISGAPTRRQGTSQSGMKSRDASKIACYYRS